ncbi:Arylsulfatase precursor [Crateriforma conspicua]|uniref:Arylsulfatase n=2 Tax=Planctomycetaceae TaxID=126 RepID=A0A5C6FU22_9PLAN|nr:Arylsulfatase precursor [Crateriforma conspicua]
MSLMFDLMRWAVLFLWMVVFYMPTQAQRPNVVLIVADDLGYSDVGFNGCKEIPTPNLDALADRGVVFECGYASHPYCSPSRAGLLTGRYQQRFGHECNPEPSESFDASPNPPGLPLTEQTIADRLRASGYSTAAIGKWHLGDQTQYWPNRRGFDHWFGFSGGGLSYWGDLGNKPASMAVHRGDTPVDRKSLTYLTDDFSEEAVRFVQRPSDQPFFLYLAYNAPHAPDQATRKHLEKTAHIEYGGRAVYGAMVAGMDEGIGKVVDALERSGKLDNTLIVFFSDNGGRKEHAMNFPYRGHKGMLFEGGIRVPFVISWPAGIAPGQRVADPVTSLDLCPTILAATSTDVDADELDGVNLMPMLDGSRPGPFPARTLFWRYAMGDDQYGYAVRYGDWKLVDSGYKNRKLLFDLSRDPWERDDLADGNPQKVQELSSLIRQWDRDNVSPRWSDAHGPHVREEELARQAIVNAASRGDKSAE